MFHKNTLVNELGDKFIHTVEIHELHEESKYKYSITDSRQYTGDWSPKEYPTRDAAYTAAVRLLRRVED